MNDDSNQPEEIKIVTVSPITRGALGQEFTYFMNGKTEPGDIVMIPLRSKKVPGLILSVTSGSEQREALRRNSFTLKKLESKERISCLTPEFLHASKIVADMFAVTIGQVVTSLISKHTLEQLKKEPSVVFAQNNSVRSEKTKLRADERVVQAPDDERITIYKSLIRESFARKKSIYFCVPDIQTAEELHPQLTRGISEYSFLFHSARSAKDVRTDWKKSLNTSHSIIIVGTGQFLSLPRADFDTIVLENESGNWKQIARPFIDVRIFAQQLARLRGNLLVYGDSVLSLETMLRYQERNLQELSPLRQRLISPVTEKIIDLKAYDKNVSDDDALVAVCSKEVAELIKSSKEKNERLVLLANRRGLSSTTVCGDCGETLTCARCLVPLVLHKDEHKNNVYVCHMCQEVSISKRFCSHCQSWKLYTYGFGIERVEQVIREYFPEHTLFILSSDTVTSRKKAIEVIEKFVSSPGSILLGTEMLLTYLREPMENSAVIHIDNLFSTPDFSATERLFHILTCLKRLTKNTFLIQTRHTQERVFEHVVRGTVLDFYREELAIRKKLQYPPFSLLIKISRMATRPVVERDMELLRNILSDYNPAIIEAFVPFAKGQYKMNAILRISPEEWPNKELVDILRSLPKEYVVNVGPENLL